MLSVVLATHNRPDSLRVAIRSVLLQTMQEWRLLVVGDACDERTAAVVADFGDERIDYLNLATRCGEQALPNTIGMALTEGEFIALLNHDDVLLADHFALALGRLAATGADLFAGKAAFARYSGRTTDGRRLPVFSEVTPDRRDLGEVFCVGCEIFEPCSAWVFRRSLFAAVGPWRAAADLYRTPMEDWLLRAWRAGARVAQCGEISVLRMLTHYQQPEGGKAYSWDPGEFALLDDLISAQRPDDIRAAILDRLHSGILDGVPKAGFATLLLKMLGKLDPEQQWLAEQLLTPAMAELYRRTGWDAFDQFCLLAGIPRGQALNIALGRRTGERLPPVPDYPALLEAARQALAMQRGA